MGAHTLECTLLHCTVQCNAVRCSAGWNSTVQCRAVHKSTHSREGFGPFSPTHVFKGFVGGTTRKLEILKKYYDNAILKPLNGNDDCSVLEFPFVQASYRV